MSILHSPTLLSRIFTSSGFSQDGLLWRSFLQWARSHVMSALKTGILVGELHIKDSEGTHSFGVPVPKRPIVCLTVLSDNVWARIVLSLDIGLSEAYMNGEFKVSHLRDLFHLWIDNRKTLEGLSTIFSTISSFATSLAIQALGRQSLSMAVRNVAEAYDTSNELFKCFLSEEMMYSCAIWGPEEHGVRGDITHGSEDGDLHSAQMRKIRHILQNARIKPGYRLLEVGTGWGAMAIEAGRHGCFVESITLSTEQKALADERIAEAGLSDRVHVHLLDYRNLPESWHHSFDAFVSCEMVEAVGLRDHPTYFKMIDWALRLDRGAAVITATAQPEFRYTELQPDDFARHYHWPNTFLPNATHFPQAAQRALPGKLVLANYEDHAPHYPRTLREWRRRFENNFQGAVVESVVKQHPPLADHKSLEAFKCKWIYMFEYAAAGYAKAYTALGCWTFARPEYIFEESD